MIKLSAFRIRNFRSIVDTGWQNLSPDNITCLIGQNESGKTSLLEGLRAFYTGTITEDVLRSDLTLPEITCRFSIEKGWLLKVTDNPGPEMKELLSGLDHIELSRTWQADFSSLIKVSGEISGYLDSLENAWRLYLDQVKTKLEEEVDEIRQLDESLSGLEERRSGLELKIGSETRSGIGFRLFRKKEAETPAASVPGWQELKKELAEVNRKAEEIKKDLKDKDSLRRAGLKYIALRDNLEKLEGTLAELSFKLEEHHQKLTLLLLPEPEHEDPDWNLVLEDYRKTRKLRDEVSSELDTHVALSAYIMEGNPEEVAEKMVSDTIHTYRSNYTSEMLGNKYFEYCPVIELFEDFGSLLPNRIDMEDIVAGNEQVEGYKAARNFLTIAKLDYTFFQQQSSRILKQKIENLNHSLTVNFQDFWQQSIGRNNKIRIQFELDHYNSSFGDKAGKPYLEFWIKDEGERLYPKQRSRGVRWFLSFYMELKASASKSDKHMVLLVDEPGVSLHARAQEDVLKVFEDIKDRIQIIYTTHSPHLVDINKLHRVLALQRDDVDSMRSNTRILDPLRLSAASPDTLTPLRSIMGNPLSGEGYSSERLNLIVNDVGTFYFLTAVLQITGYSGKVSLIPSTDVSTIPLMCNIMMGWGLRFAVILFSNEDEKKMEELLNQSIFRTEENGNELIKRMGDAFLNAEDMLSTLDFKTHILGSREGITVSNSVYLKEKELPRNFLLSRFLSQVKSGTLTIRNLDEESVENFRNFTAMVKGLK
ncbi:MAG TPA: AAA family ATPase [Bacteroidales bacterium]|nr:AAA family ATPase [Bacteroidales bacterium]